VEVETAESQETHRLGRGGGARQDSIKSRLSREAEPAVDLIS
jgi:hypothetical protein